MNKLRINVCAAAMAACCALGGRVAAAQEQSPTAFGVGADFGVSRLSKPDVLAAQRDGPGAPRPGAL